MLSKVLLACTVAVAMADHAPYHPAPYHPASAPYHAPAPAPYHPPKPHAPHYAPEKLPPRPFAYEYGVKDEYSGAYFAKQETQDDYGVVHGEYRVALPDGRTQIVTYTADHENGYIADVKYEGEPHYEPYVAPKHPAPYHAPKPAPYKPAPAPYVAPKPAPYHPAPAPYHPAPAYKPAPVYHPAPAYKPAPAPYHPAPYHG